jgi:hypothetical protein
MGEEDKKEKGGNNELEEAELMRLGESGSLC